MSHFIVILHVLMENQLFSKYSKCEFRLRSVAFLGYIIYNEEVEVDPRKIEAFKNCTTLLTQTKTRGFLGLAGYYRRFVEGFASIASFLTTLTQKSVKFEWSEACERSFQILKDRLTYLRC